jgi:hypothetical protein
VERGLHREAGKVSELQEPLRTDVVAIIVPRYKRSLSVKERVSPAHLTKVLGKYDTHVVAPETLEFGGPAFEGMGCQMKVVILQDALGTLLTEEMEGFGREY